METVQKFADPIDAANDLAERQNQSAIDKALAAAKPDAEAVMIDGVACCCDCHDPILAARLDAKPDVCRCIECQSVHDARSVKRG